MNVHAGSEIIEPSVPLSDAPLTPFFVIVFPRQDRCGQSRDCTGVNPEIKIL